MKELDIKGLDTKESIDEILRYVSGYKKRYFITIAGIVFIWLVINVYMLRLDYLVAYLRAYFFENVGALLLCILFFTNIKISREKKIYPKLYSILTDECDPHRFIEVVDELRKVAPFKKTFDSKIGTVYIAACHYDEDYDKALGTIEMLRNSRKNDAGDMVTCTLFEGVILAKTGKIEEAKKCLNELKEMLGSDTGSSKITNLEAAIAYAQKDYEKAASLYGSMIEGAGNDISKISLNYSCGNAEYEQGKYEEAKIHYHAALEVNKIAKLKLMVDLKEKYGNIVS